MRLSERKGLTLRAFAGFFAAFCVIASARALIPGLCATLTSLDREKAALCRAPDHACCQTAPQGDTPTAVTAPEVHCAFCALVHAVAHTESIPEVVLAKFPTPPSLAAHDFYVPDPAGTDAYPRRGPPIV